MYLPCIRLNFLCFGVVIASWQLSDLVCFCQYYLLKLILTDPVYLQASLDSVSWLVLSEMELPPKLHFQHNRSNKDQRFAIFRPENFREQQSVVRLEKEKRTDMVQAEKRVSPSCCLCFWNTARSIVPGWFISSARNWWWTLGEVHKSPLTEWSAWMPRGALSWGHLVLLRDEAVPFLA